MKRFISSVRPVNASLPWTDTARAASRDASGAESSNTRHPVAPVNDSMWLDLPTMGVRRKATHKPAMAEQYKKDAEARLQKVEERLQEAQNYATQLEQVSLPVPRFTRRRSELMSRFSRTSRVRIIPSCGTRPHAMFAWTFSMIPMYELCAFIMRAQPADPASLQCGHAACKAW
jgi:hypothetical protein